jgi:hypothetical protein
MKALLRLDSLLLLSSLVTFVPAALRAQDIRGYEIDRYEYFTQCTTNRAPLDTARSHYLSAFVIGNYGGAVLTGTLAHSSVTWPLTNTSSELRGRVQLTSAAAAGPYTFTATTASQGVQRRTVSLPGLANGIAPARIANWSEAQQVEATKPFTVQWDSIKGTGKRDLLKFRVINSEDQMLMEHELAKEDTSFTIPGGTLTPGTTNTAFLYIVHLASRHPSRSSWPGSLSVEVRATRFTLQTLHPEGQLLFGSHQLFARESDGVINIPVNRTGAEGTVTVDYFTENGTAQAGLNYMSTNGTLTFPPGITNHLITVPLRDDGQASGPLIARVRLTNTTGGVLLPRQPWLDWSILDTQAAPGQNVNAVVLSKVSFYFQTNDNVGDQLTRCVSSRFFTSVHPKFPGALSNAFVRLPRKSTRPVDMPYRTFLEHNEDFPTRTLTDRQFPVGPYAVEVNTLTQGQLIESLRMTAEPRFPVPHLTNWTAAQTIDSTAPFTLHWESFAGATSNDFVLLSVQDDVGVYLLQTPETFEPGALPGTAASYEIPANTLTAGERYFVGIIFAKTTRCETDAASGVKNCIIFDHTTSLFIHAQANATTALTHSAKAQFKGESECCNGDAFQNIVETPFLDAFIGQK